MERDLDKDVFCWYFFVFFLGPIASYMTNRLGWRLTTVIDSVLASAGLCLSAVAPSVFILCFTAGGLLGKLDLEFWAKLILVVSGLGLGIIYLPRLDCITQYFDKKRPFVTGIAICGSGIGTFIMAPLTDVWVFYSVVLLRNFIMELCRLLNMYDWKLCLVILGGVCFTNCFFGLMFKPLPKCQVLTFLDKSALSNPADTGTH